jgi:SAM-dependent MidA family methyltransferase
MGSFNSAPAGASPEFLAVFRTHAEPDGTMPFDEFMRLALYDERVGYYRQPRKRIGYGPGTDFFTASTSGPIFGELVVAACTKLLGGENLHDYTFVEIGAEPADPTNPTSVGGILNGVAHPFAEVRTVPLGSEATLRGRCVVFSNELFDAQPFRRFVFRGDTWRELGVQLHGEVLTSVELPATAPAELPRSAIEGYVIDAPLAARYLACNLAAQPWTGLFIAADYGKSWRELTEATPAGTARAYFRHQQSNELLAQPGDQDLTCHICWDWVEAALSDHGFAAPVVETQEAFFLHHAVDAIAAFSTAEAGRFTPKKLALLQLLHPGQFGQKFQVLHARRNPT